MFYIRIPVFPFVHRRFLDHIPGLAKHIHWCKHDAVSEKSFYPLARSDSLRASDANLHSLVCPRLLVRLGILHRHSTNAPAIDPANPVSEERQRASPKSSRPEARLRTTDNYAPARGQANRSIDR